MDAQIIAGRRVARAEVLCDFDVFGREFGLHDRDKIADACAESFTRMVEAVAKGDVAESGTVLCMWRVRGRTFEAALSWHTIWGSAVRSWIHKDAEGDVLYDLHIAGHNVAEGRCSFWNGHTGEFSVRGRVCDEENGSY